MPDIPQPVVLLKAATMLARGHMLKSQQFKSQHAFFMFFVIAEVKAEESLDTNACTIPFHLGFIFSFRIMYCRYEFPSEFSEALDHATSSGKDTKVLLRMTATSVDTSEDP